MLACAAVFSVFPPSFPFSASLGRRASSVRLSRSLVFCASPACRLSVRFASYFAFYAFNSSAGERRFSFLSLFVALLPCVFSPLRFALGIAIMSLFSPVKRPRPMRWLIIGLLCLALALFLALCGMSGKIFFGLGLADILIIAFTVLLVVSLVSRIRLALFRLRLRRDAAAGPDVPYDASGRPAYDKRGRNRVVMRDRRDIGDKSRRWGGR